MGLVNAEQIIGCLQSYRLCWINGRFGGGKTSLAYALAEVYLKKGYRLLTNNYCVWADRLEDVSLDKDGHLKAVVILDEGGQYVQASVQVKMMMSYAAKMDIILMIPSFFPPAAAAQVVQIQPLWNIRGTGIPLIFYRWSVKSGTFKDRGSFIWFRPETIFGIYSRQDPSDRADEIVNFLVEKAEEYRRMFGRRDKVSSMVQVTEVDRLEDVAGSLAETANEFVSVSVRKHSR